MSYYDVTYSWLLHSNIVLCYGIELYRKPCCSKDERHFQHHLCWLYNTWMVRKDVYQGPSKPWGISPGDFSELEDLANHTLNGKTLLQKLTSTCQGCSPLQRSAHNHGAPYFWLHHWLYIPSTPNTISVSVCSVSINTRMWAAESPKNHTHKYTKARKHKGNCIINSRSGLELEQCFW